MSLLSIHFFTTGFIYFLFFRLSTFSQTLSLSLLSHLNLSPIISLFCRAIFSHFSFSTLCFVPIFSLYFSHFLIHFYLSYLWLSPQTSFSQFTKCTFSVNFLTIFSYHFFFPLSFIASISHSALSLHILALKFSNQLLSVYSLQSLSLNFFTSLSLTFLHFLSPLSLSLFSILSPSFLYFGMSLHLSTFYLYFLAFHSQFNIYI